MSITADIKKAISHCVKEGIPFAVYRADGRSCVFIADCGHNEPTATYTVSPWNSTEKITINGRCDERQVIDFTGPGYIGKNMQSPTETEEYLNSLAKVIEYLETNGGKVVISRIENIENSTISVVDAAKNLFDKFPNAFCHLYYHPACGLWLGATPELLFKSDADGKMQTMALAGTIAKDKQWDDKNRHEHQLVADFINATLRENGADFTQAPTESLIYGDIKHLCTKFEGEIESMNLAETIATELSPTPAVAGSPREKALGIISKIEQHDRRCYAGYISIKTSKYYEAYVNLRCAELHPGFGATVYSGGGITSESIPTQELAETQSKSSILKHILSLS